ncbi:hypothetical protein COU60_03505 [Candidatus Pacearchaeota archaeon CG10_big_fil_rev_8_21_14_0_10_34_76]|nr:MAG: hypothetical protein COU60_03505 [Candidatus Pacearchaeota archaeon CG10_big_fil_rev_8_21_14_0_10_34_76]
MKSMIYVKKMDGRLQPYDENKLRRSLKKSGASKETIKDILSKVDSILYNGIETKKLFKFIFQELNKCSPNCSPRYNLKQAIISLGFEGGFVFEKFMGKLFEKKGYDVKLNQIVRGKNISHEIDVIAIKDKDRIMIEAKHHGKPWLGTDIQTALYVYARFLDTNNSFTRPMLVTNTRFSTSVMRYAKGVNLSLMGWKYPKGNSLEENIEKYKIYPITVLNLPEVVLKRYFEKDIITLEDLQATRKLSPEEKDKINKIMYPS